ncbi:MAG TPA: hypothetical protein VEC37_08420 [Bacillota bacterium]|nr:hypothetical protein [Bacillota bacterium]
MLSSEDLEKIKEMLSQIWADHSPSSKAKPGSKSDKKNAKGNNEKSGNKANEAVNCFDLIPSELLIITGLIIGVFNVESVLVNRNQVVQIVLAGNLRRKTELEKVMEQVGQQPFDQVVKAIIENNL